MRKLFTLLLVIALPAITSAQLVMFTGTFSGLQETPPNASPATGWATATLDLSTLAFELDYAFSGLTGTQTAAHIHGAPPGVAGPIIIPLPVGSPVSDFMQILTAGQATALQNELWYVNIHSTLFPGGEIRAQLELVPAAVPEPSTYAIGGALLLGALVMARRRKIVR